MPFSDIPTERLLRFRELLGLSDLSENPLARWAEVLGATPDDFADRIQGFVKEAPQLRIIQDNLPDPAKLRRNWAEWFAGLFRQGLGEELLTRLWRSGQAHVAYNVDHRLISMAYALARAYLHERVAASLPAADAPGALRSIDALIDFSLLVETDAYVTFATRCELDVIQGIAHQVRNPIAVIGGQARRLLRLRGQDADVAEAAQIVLEEAGRLDALARSVTRYMDVTDREPVTEATMLTPILHTVLARIAALPDRPKAVLNVAVAPEADRLAVAPADLDALLTALLDNAVRYAAPGDPRVTVRCQPSEGRPGFAKLTIDNTGQTLSAEELTRIFSPFHSTDPMATGMGLAMAKAITRKYSGGIAMGLLSGGTRCVVTLPQAPAATA
ncbi:sensor histidine kinase [Desulfovibrio sp. TomC]|uniref:sensor histidine kinase n=1 Tax=Desulfovibrio sp. TomC TaxID=1562888 RepID=UPI00057576FD|nr:HAMP domain-containing sensor histidine kinase [Desulfovibrio sp. TomC]KHK04548.1 sensor histidine kinase [Desulfovibrio sp. TomC]